jgi:hypothetical protein
MFVVSGFYRLFQVRYPRQKWDKACSNGRPHRRAIVVGSGCTGPTVWSSTKNGWENFRILLGFRSRCDLNGSRLSSDSPGLWYSIRLALVVQFNFSMWQELLRVNVLTGLLTLLWFRIGSFHVATHSLIPSYSFHANSCTVSVDVAGFAAKRRHRTRPTRAGCAKSVKLRRWHLPPCRLALAKQHPALSLVSLR